MWLSESRVSIIDWQLEKRGLYRVRIAGGWVMSEWPWEDEDQVPVGMLASSSVWVFVGLVQEVRWDPWEDDIQQLGWSLNPDHITLMPSLCVPTVHKIAFTSSPWLQCAYLVLLLPVSQAGFVLPAIPCGSNINYLFSVAESQSCLQAISQLFTLSSGHILTFSSGHSHLLSQATSSTRPTKTFPSK